MAEHHKALTFQHAGQLIFLTNRLPETGLDEAFAGDF
jgi:hypothetical protein